MRRFWIRSLAAQIICAMLLALGLSQAIGFMISWDERGRALLLAAKSEFLSRTASLAQLLEATPSTLENDILSASDTAYTRFWVSPDEPIDSTAWRHEAWAQLARPLPSLMHVARGERGPEREASQASNPANGIAAALAATANLTWVTLPAHAWPLSRPAKFLHLDEGNGMGIAVRLDSGAWLNAAYSKTVPNSIWTSQTAVSLAITAAVLSLIAIFVARSIARPMRRLAAAAEALGRGETVTPLPEWGPDDIRQTAEAFNRMQERLQRFVEDRTRMLAAISHDLRTPLTSLRLRAEFVSDPDAQEKMLKTIGEIQTMTEAALAFAREEATAEDTRMVDLPALVESLCDDLAELGHNVAFIDGPAVNYRCRPDALRRAIRNLIENAIRYGERARVRVARTAKSIDIIVDDDGPGIPEDTMEQVFAPFYRIEDSRNRETGGVGLGLSIARAIARHHGGDVVLSNVAQGLQATISLPQLS
jgi:signal transduction histidine kinase